MTPLVAALLDPAAWPHGSPRLIETHISWVILAGEHAYKIKKPLNLGFLDFSSLDKREQCCREEVRLNRRLAPDIYLGVVPIAGTPPRLEGEGPILEWAVKMRAFPAEATLDREPEISAAQIDAIADTLARFHASISPAPDTYGTAAAVRAPVAENFRQLRELLPTPDTRLDALEVWSEAEGHRLASHFAARRAEGYIRECHGDLHLGNIAWLTETLPPLTKGGREGLGARDAGATMAESAPPPLLQRGETVTSPSGRPLIFDGIEFNPGLRSIDVISEVAFLGMDLMHRGHAALAWRLLNRYLEHSGDYAGLVALPYYLTYRALVRAKVEAIRASQSNGDFAATRAYLELAQRLTRRPPPALLLMHGVSGTGKTWHSQLLLEQLAAIRLRSDVERKRLFGLDALADSRALETDIYSREAGERTLARLLALTQTLLDAGFRVIVDATFIKRDWREPFQRLAEARTLPWFVIALEAPAELLRQRVLARQAGGRDASEATVEVLEAQLAVVEPFAEGEIPHVLHPGADPNQALSQLQAVLP